MTEQIRLRVGDLVLDGTGDGQTNADAMAAIRAAQLERNIQLPEMRFNNVIRSPIAFPRGRRRFMIPNHERRQQVESPSQAARITRRASLRRVNAQRLVERRLSAQRQRRSAHSADDAQRLPQSDANDVQPSSTRRANSQRVSLRRLGGLRNSTRHMSSSVRRRRRAMSVNRASRSLDRPPNLADPVMSEATATGTYANESTTSGSAVAAYADTPARLVRRPATPSPQSRVQARVTPARVRFPSPQVTLFRSRQRPLTRTFIRWNQESTSSSSSSTSNDATGTLVTADGALTIQAGSTPFRNLVRSATNRPVPTAARTQRNVNTSNHNSPLATITSRLGTRSDISFGTLEPNSDTVRSIPASSQVIPATSTPVPTSGVHTANLDIRSDRILMTASNANNLNSSTENSETGKTQISMGSSQ